MINYTKGEWKVQYCGQGLTNIILNNDNDDVIAIVDNSRDNHSPNDADLISQAPAMYEALRTFLKLPYSQKHHNECYGIDIQAHPDCECCKYIAARCNAMQILSKLEGEK